MRVLHRAAGSESVAEPASKEPRLSGQTAHMSVLESQLDSARKGGTVRHISSVHATVKTASALRFSDGGGLTPSLNICGVGSQVFTVWPNPALLCRIDIYKFRLEEEW